MPPLPAWLRDQMRDSHNALVAAVEECWGPDSPLIQELGGYDLSLPSDTDVSPGTAAWYEEYLESEK